MKPEEKLICDFMYNFTNKNWNKIYKKKCEITKRKSDFLEVIASDVQMALWVLTEVCRWGMDQEYLKELYVDLPDGSDFNVINIDDKYIKLKWIHEPVYEYQINFCQPKTKTITYFD